MRYHGLHGSQARHPHAVPLVHALGGQRAGAGARGASLRRGPPGHGDRAHRRPAGRRGGAPARAGGADGRARDGLPAGRALPALLLRRRHLRRQGERVAQAHRGAAGAHRQHRRPARGRGLRPPAPQRALRARPGVVGAALRGLPPGGDVPRQPGEDAAVLVPATAAPAPVRLARRGHRLVRGGPRPCGAHVPRRVPRDPAGRGPRDVRPGLRARAGADSHRVRRRRRAAQGARGAAAGAPPARRRAPGRGARRVRRRPAGAALRAARAAGLGGPRAVPRAGAARRGRGAAARRRRLLRPVVRSRVGGRRSARGHGVRRRRARLGDPRVRRGGAERGHRAAGAAARRAGARGGALPHAVGRRAAAPSLGDTRCAPCGATTWDRVDRRGAPGVRRGRAPAAAPAAAPPPPAARAVRRLPHPHAPQQGLRDAGRRHPRARPRGRAWTSSPSPTTTARPAASRRASWRTATACASSSARRSRAARAR